LHDSARKDSTHGYGGFTGTPDLRRAFSDYYRRRFEVDLDPGTQVLPLIGSKEGIVNIAFALVNPGQVVLVPELAYPAYAAGAYLAAGEPVDYRLDAVNG
jgi:aspartate/methionine/tyrosine aminotransferase